MRFLFISYKTAVGLQPLLQDSSLIDFLSLWTTISRSGWIREL